MASEKKIILNITEGTFFVYSGDYAALLNPLFEKQKCGSSRWQRTDKIVFVPESVPHEYVMGNYERIYPPIHRRR
jgi:hypothetical protein